MILIVVYFIFMMLLIGLSIYLIKPPHVYWVVGVILLETMIGLTIQISALYVKGLIH